MTKLDMVILKPKNMILDETGRDRMHSYLYKLTQSAKMSS